METFLDSAEADALKHSDLEPALEEQARERADAEALESLENPEHPSRE
jgi:hypothetical protein